jgi:hypothetical protein
MINSTPVIDPTRRKLDEYQQACVDLLSDALENALAGRITSVAVVVCMDDGMATVMAGKNGAALNIGCDDLKKKIHAAMFEDGNVAAKKSSIIQPGRRN